MGKIKERGKTYALHKASERLHDYYGNAMLGVVQFNGYDIQDAYIEGCNHINEGMIEALRTEYEKGRADVIADTLSWLENCWPKYCSNPNIIDAYKEGVVKD